MWYVYMIRNEHNDLYIGVSDNPERRLQEHNTGRGAQHTKRGVFGIVFLEQHGTLTAARRREIQLKRWRRDKKEALVQKYSKGEPTAVSHQKDSRFILKNT